MVTNNRYTPLLLLMKENGFSAPAEWWGLKNAHVDSVTDAKSAEPRLPMYRQPPSVRGPPSPSCARSEPKKECPGCFVQFSDRVSAETLETCRLCLPGWAKKKTRGKKEKEISYVTGHSVKDVGGAYNTASREYQRRKRSNLGLSVLADFQQKNDSPCTSVSNPDCNCCFCLQSRIRESEVHYGVEGQEEVAPEPPVKPLDCQYIKRLRGLAQGCVEMLKQDRNLVTTLKIPERITCGGLRAAVRSLYPKSLSVSDELSVKTAQKLELQACKFCSPELLAAHETKWAEKVCAPRDLDPAHLILFKKALRMNVDSGWNKACPTTAFVPNGHGALGPVCDPFTRKNGGNWNEESFSDRCRVTTVFSSGKPRVVTLFSSYNQKILRPLHRSLYATLGRKSWLLQGPPTEEKISALNGGDYHSFDFAAATDSLGSEYVGAVIEELIRKGSGLTEDDIRCMWVLKKQTFGWADWETKSGQPMGSLMSFPMLCIINKTLMDMALADSLGILHNRNPKGAVKVFSEHRCLINGDDALVRDPPNQKKKFRDCFIYHGSRIGLVVNQEKSMRSARLAEINSTVFEDGIIKKKTNLKILGIGKENVGDIIGVVSDATCSRRGFTFGLSRCSDALALQHDKKVSLHPEYVGIIKNHKKIRDAVRVIPTSLIEHERNLFPVVEKPDGYDLFPSQEREILNHKVDHLRSLRVVGSEFNRELDLQRKRIKKQKRKAVFCEPRNANRVCRERRRRPQETILEVFALAWTNEKKDLSDNRWLLPSCPVPARIEKDTRCTIERLIQMIRCPSVT